MNITFVLNNFNVSFLLYVIQIAKESFNYCIDKLYYVAQNASWSDDLPMPYLKPRRVVTSLEMTHWYSICRFLVEKNVFW